MSQHHLPHDWYEKTLHALGAPRSLQNSRLMIAWARAEGGGAAWNPLNTTLDLPGATNYNPTGVKNYPREEWGIAATIITLTDPAIGVEFYAGILKDLRNGSLTAEQIVGRNEEEFKTWGTNPSTIINVLKDL